MIRRVAFAKAVLAGAAGAAAWEAAARVVRTAGIPLFDLVHFLGTIPPGWADAPPWRWWPLGMALHALVGAVWAIFYAYFFWTRYDWRPAVQGLAFSAGPAVLAGLVMVPQMGWMHGAVEAGRVPHPGVFARRAGPGGPAGVIVGHAVYGLTMGALYTRPVGYRTGTRPLRLPLPLPRTAPVHAAGGQRDAAAPTPGDGRFLFATGIECSYPTIEGGRWRMDQLAETLHYRYWRRDLELVRELGLRYLRYGPPLHLIHLGPGRYDWSFMDAVAGAMRDLDIVPIIDLCHFGVPDWVGDFQDPRFPQCLAEYAAAFANRYPWVRLYTPVNEMYVTARMSALDGWWNEQLRSERAFVTAVGHVARAGLLSMEAILRQRPDAVFVNSESSEFFQACCPDERVRRVADFENQRRFIPLDLLYGMPPRDDVRRYLFDHGLTADEYAWFMDTGRRVARRCVLGLDYYDWNEKLINSDGRPESLGELFGWYVITRQYFDRYRRPLMHTETNCRDARAAPGWLWRQWHNVQLMRQAGVPVIGLTWYSLQDQVDWDVGIGKARGNVIPVGLFDLNRDARPVAQAYRHLLKTFADEPLAPGAPGVDLDGLLERWHGAPGRDAGAGPVAAGGPP